MIGLVPSVVLWLVALHGAPAPAPPTTGVPGILSTLVGAWEGEGELFGRPATFSMSWAWTLDRRFVRLDFENRLVQADGAETTVLRAVAMYRVGEGERSRGTWFDTRGEILELEAVASDASLTTRWTAATEEGRTTYRRIDEDTVEVTDEVRDGEGWRLFGRATYRRTSVGNEDRRGADPVAASLPIR